MSKIIKQHITGDIYKCSNSWGTHSVCCQITLCLIYSVKYLSSHMFFHLSHHFFAQAQQSKSYRRGHADKQHKRWQLQTEMTLSVNDRICQSQPGRGRHTKAFTVTTVNTFPLSQSRDSHIDLLTCVPFIIYTSPSTPAPDSPWSVTARLPVSFIYSIPVYEICAQFPQVWCLHL